MAKPKRDLLLKLIDNELKIILFPKKKRKFVKRKKR